MYLAIGGEYLRERMSENEWMEIFGDNLQSALDDIGMTQKELAEEAELSEATISSYIHKRKLPSLKAIINISYALNWNIDEMIDFGSRIG